MSRILTGVQSTGVPHLGNILGAILPAIELSKQDDIESFLFIADLHSVTQVKDAKTLRNNTLSTAAAWLACGLNPEKTIFYRQSDIPQVTELAWYLSCFFPYQRLTLAHSFKDKSDRLKDVNSGLFTYPVLMAADILLYDAEIVPVGNDQLQHLEFARDIASRFNHQMGEVFVLPKPKLQESTMWVPGRDGEKMSKSKENTIQIFQEDKKLQKEIKKIKTDNTPLEGPMNKEGDIVFQLYSLLAEEQELKTLENKYDEGGFGFGRAKEAFFDLVKDKFSEEREHFNDLMRNPEIIEEALLNGAERAKTIADEKIEEVRNVLGFS